MDWRRQAYLQRQQQRWLRPDAARWVRPDAGKFLKPGTRPADVYPALARKYDDNQPRVPAGNSDGGQWTSGSGGSGRLRVHIYRSNPDDQTGDGGDAALSLPMGSLDFGDIGSEIDKLNLFDITPRERAPAGVRLAGDPIQLPAILVTPDESTTPRTRGIGDNGGPPLEDPPEIPLSRPEESADRTSVQRSAATWIARAIGLGVAVDAYMGVLKSVEWLNQYQAAIETYRDPPQTYQKLMEAVGRARAGTEVHHVIERTALERLGLSRREIDAPQNRVRIPTLKHYEISSYYSKPNMRYGDQTPRKYLADKSLEERFRVGIQALIDVGVLTP